MKKFCIVILASLFVNSIVAQNLPLSNQYLVNKYVLSPSYAGIDEGVKVFLGYRDQWVDFQGAPVNKMINVHSPVGKSIGVGGMIFNEQEGIFNRLYGSLSYSYHLKLADMHNLSFGLEGKFFQSSINLNQAIIEDLANDAVLQSRQTQNETVFNAGASVLYRFQGINVGFAVPFIMNSTSKYYNAANLNDDENFLLKRHYLGHASYDYEINDMFAVTPYAIIRMTDHAPASFEFAGKFTYNQMAWLAFSYRREGNFGASAGFQLNDQVYLNYTYEFAGNGMTGNTAGTHDFTLGIVLGKGMKQMKEEQKKLLEKNDSLAGEAEILKEELEETEEKAKKDNQKQDNKIDILQQRLNDVELEMGKLKSGVIEGTENLSPEEAAKRKELNAEIMDIERKLKDVGGEFFIVVEAFKVKENAERSITLWADRGLRVNMIYNDVRDFYYIYAGKYATYNEALQMKNRLKEEGIFGWIYLWAH